MLQAARMVHEGHHTISHRRMPGVTRLGGHAQVGEPQFRRGQAHKRLLGPLLRAALLSMDKQANIQHTEGTKPEQEKAGRSHQRIRWPSRMDATMAGVISAKVTIAVPLWSCRKDSAAFLPAKGMNSCPMGP